MRGSSIENSRSKTGKDSGIIDKIQKAVAIVLKTVFVDT